MLEACAALQAAGCEVLGVVSIFTYGLPKAEEAFAKAELPYYSLTDYDTLTEVALENGNIHSDDLKSCKHGNEIPSQKIGLKNKNKFK